MIDKKKIANRLKKIWNAEKVKSMPLVNLYILVTAILQVIGEGFSVSFLQLIKPIPIILMIYYIHFKSTRQCLVLSFVEMGLIFSLLGDILLMSNEESSFLIGTMLFVVAHLLYVIGFSMGEQIRSISNSYKQARRAAWVIILILLVINIVTLYDKLPSKGLFVVYMIVLAVEAFAALKRYEATTPASFNFVLVGVLLFAVSDNLLGFLKFNGIKTNLGRAVVMLSYYAAQYFIMHGIIHQSNLELEIHRIRRAKGA